MSKLQRIFIEIVAPPFLGAFISTVTGSGSDTPFAERVFYFPLLVLMAYVLCIIPSFLYMLAMELWFWLGLRARCGLLCTVSYSVFLGCGAGLVIAYVTDFYQILSTDLLWIGSLVGLLIGFYVSKQKASAT